MGCISLFNRNKGISVLARPLRTAPKTHSSVDICRNSVITPPPQYTHLGSPSALCQRLQAAVGKPICSDNADAWVEGIVDGFGAVCHIFNFQLYTIICVHLWWCIQNPTSSVDDCNDHRQWPMMLRHYGYLVQLLNSNILAQFLFLCVYYLRLWCNIISMVLHHNPHFGGQSDGHNPYQIDR